jgi:hypothetical protein
MEAESANPVCKVSIISYRKARLDTSIRVKFQDSPAPVRFQSASNNHPWTPANSQEPFLGSQNQSPATGFPIMNLSTAQQPISPVQYGPPTPPLDSEGDEMDWTPAKNEFRPTRSPQIHQPTPAHAAPSPFYGRLPPAPIAPAQRLRNPPNRPTFRKASATQKQSFLDGFAGSTSATVQRTSSSLARISREDIKPDFPEEPLSSRRMEMAPQRFAPPLEETGLESLFNGVFSLSEDPVEVRAILHHEEKETEHNPIPPSRPKSPQKRARWDLIGCMSILAFAPWAWWYAERVVLGSQALRFISLGLAATVLLRELAEILKTGKAYWRLSDILLLVVELGVATFLARAVASFTTQLDGVKSDLGIWPTVFFVVLLLQESLVMKHDLSNAISMDSTSDSKEAKISASESKPAATTSPGTKHSVMAIDETVNSQQRLPVENGMSEDLLVPLRKRPMKYQATI